MKFKNLPSSFLNSLFISDCFDCDKIEIKFSNDAKDKQGWLAGIYEATAPVNGFPAWISGSKAIWKRGGQWIFGSASDIGSGYRNIISNDDTECPHEVSSWHVYSSSGSIDVTSSDVSIECYEFIGKTNFLKN